MPFSFDIRSVRTTLPVRLVSLGSGAPIAGWLDYVSYLEGVGR